MAGAEGEGGRGGTKRQMTNLRTRPIYGATDICLIHLSKVTMGLYNVIVFHMNIFVNCILLSV